MRTLNRGWSFWVRAFQIHRTVRERCCFDPDTDQCDCSGSVPAAHLYLLWRALGLG